MTIHSATRAPIAALLFLAIAAAAACAGMITDPDAGPPPAQEFGFGPRTSVGGVYQARVQPLQPIRVGQMHSWRLEIHDRDSVGVVGAAIAVDGGMPQHGHGLPTKPKVTKELGNGQYEVEGMRFNMGGWWVVRFRIESPAGTDSVTFNLAL